MPQRRLDQVSVGLVVLIVIVIIIGAWRYRSLQTKYRDLETISKAPITQYIAPVHYKTLYRDGSARLEHPKLETIGVDGVITNHGDASVFYVHSRLLPFSKTTGMLVETNGSVPDADHKYESRTYPLYNVLKYARDNVMGKRTFSVGIVFHHDPKDTDITDKESNVYLSAHVEAKDEGEFLVPMTLAGWKEYSSKGAKDNPIISRNHALEDLKEIEKDTSFKDEDIFFAFRLKCNMNNHGVAVAADSADEGIPFNASATKWDNPLAQKDLNATEEFLLGDAQIFIDGWNIKKSVKSAGKTVNNVTKVVVETSDELATTALEFAASGTCSVCKTAFELIIEANNELNDAIPGFLDDNSSGVATSIYCGGTFGATVAAMGSQVGGPTGSAVCGGVASYACSQIMGPYIEKAKNAGDKLSSIDAHKAAKKMCKYAKSISQC